MPVLYRRSLSVYYYICKITEVNWFKIGKSARGTWVYHQFTPSHVDLVQMLQEV